MGNNRKRSGIFRLKRFSIKDEHCGMKVGTDSVILGAWASLPQDGLIIDIGAGSGILSLMCSQRSQCRVMAVEIDPDAVADMRYNVDNSPWHDDRIVVINDDILSWPETAAETADFIISNPPFFTESLKSCDNRRSLARHGDGFDVLKLIEIAPRLLSPQGGMAFVAPVTLDDEIVYRATLSRLHCRRHATMRQRPSLPPSRSFWQLSRVDGTCIEEEIIIRDNQGVFTDRYKNLTSDFYLDF